VTAARAIITGCGVALDLLDDWLTDVKCRRPKDLTIDCGQAGTFGMGDGAAVVNPGVHRRKRP